MLLLGAPAVGPVSVLPCLLPLLQETPGLSLLHLPRRMQGTQLSIPEPLLACLFFFFFGLGLFLLSLWLSLSLFFFFFFIEFVTMLLLFYILAFCLLGM